MNINTLLLEANRKSWTAYVKAVEANPDGVWPTPLAKAKALVEFYTNALKGTHKGSKPNPNL